MHGGRKAQREIELKDGAKRRRTISAFTRVNALPGGARGILDFNFSLRCGLPCMLRENPPNHGVSPHWCGITLDTAPACR